MRFVKVRDMCREFLSNSGEICSKGIPTTHCIRIRDRPLTWPCGFRDAAVNVVAGALRRAPRGGNCRNPRLQVLE